MILKLKIRFYLQTPDVIVTLKHWYALLKIEREDAFNLKVNFKLRKEHLDPKYFQKINVALAIQVRIHYSLLFLVIIIIIYSFL